MEMLARFLYGQILFALGVALYVQSRRYSRLALARALPWMAGFSFLSAFHAWIDLFPALPAYQTEWQILQGCLFGWAYISLLCAAWRLWPGRLRWSLPLCWWGALAVAALWTVFVTGQVLETRGVGLLETWGKVLLGFPAVLLTAYTLRRHAQKYILPLESPSIYRTLQIGGVAFFVFGLFLLMDVVPSAWMAWLPFPPIVWQLMALVGFMWGMLQGLDIFEVETRRRLEAMELTQTRQMERQQIAKDLHDGALQHVYAAGLLLQSLEKRLAEEEQAYLRRAQESLNLAIRQLREILHQAEEPLDGHLEIHRALAALVEEARRISGADIAFKAEPVSAWDVRRASHLIFFAREALANAIRHAQSPYIEVRLRRDGDYVRLEILDKGRGMPREVTPGFGLQNMRERALLLGGHMHIESEPGRGTRVVLTAPITG